MNILVTAGNTQTPVDRVRCITNIFSGRTGAQVAATAFDRGHTVMLLTSHPEVLAAIPSARERVAPGWRVRSYRTFDDLEALMAAEITSGAFDVVIHAAAVSDYHVAGVFTHRDGQFADASAGKVKGSHPELWLKLTPAPKLVDKVRGEWGLRGDVGEVQARSGRVGNGTGRHRGALAFALTGRPDVREHPRRDARLGADRCRTGRLPACRAGAARLAFAGIGERGVTRPDRPASNSAVARCCASAYQEKRT